MDSHLEDLLELRQEFEKFDKHDVEAIRKWFADHPYLSTAEQAQVAGKSRWYIRNLKRRAGLTKPPPKVLPKSTAKPQSKLGIEVPEDWDNREWLEKAVQIGTVAQIAKAVGRSRQVIMKRLKRMNIPYSRRKTSKNPCCNKAWLHKHYVEQGLTQQECANLAGISVENFANWLVRFSIPVRRQPTGTAAPLWVYRLVHQLEHHPAIRLVALRPDHIHVRFKHFIWESYYPNRTGKRIPFSYFINKEDSRLEHIPPVLYQFESELDGTNHYPHHLQISKPEWDKASLMEKRIALHCFGQRVFNNRYRQLEYPPEIIEKELFDIQTADTGRLIRDSGFATFAKFANLSYSPGRKIIEHFFDFSQIWNDVLISPRYITHTLNYVAQNNITINTHNMLSVVITGYDAIRHKKFPNIPTPLVYAAVLKSLKIKGPILDLHTGFGERALACAILGLPYYYIPNQHFEDALQRGFAEFVGLDCRPHNGEKVDLLFCDTGLRELPDLRNIGPLARCASHMLVFVPKHQRRMMLEKLPPSSAIPIRNRFYEKYVSYFFLY